MRTQRLTASALAVATVFLAGCAAELIPTPYVMYGEAGQKVYEATPAALRTPEIPVLYVSDRVVKETDDEGPEYGYGRNPAMEFGVATVSLGEGITWDQLVADSTTGNRSRSYHPRVSKVERVGTIPPAQWMLEAREGRLWPKPDAKATMMSAYAALMASVSRWLEGSQRKEVVVFVHGFNNTFDDAVIRVAEAWHLGGRQGVPIAFSWPAGSGGLRGYTQDRESGEFAGVHLKILLLMLARCPQVEKIHIVAHSRGTDVAVTALRELNAEARGYLRSGGLVAFLSDAPPSGEIDRREPYEVLKIETLVLAAPDLDLEVFAQRFFGENVLRAANRTIIYFSEGDEAIGLASWLFRSRRRLGALHADDIPKHLRPMLAQLSALELVDCKVKSSSIGASHAYVLQHPSAFSDLVLALRDQKRPGVENGRPLELKDECVWVLDNDYLKPAKK